MSSYTVQSGSVSRRKDENGQSLQMAKRALMTPDKPKYIPKGELVTMKTGSHPMRMRLVLDWSITVGEPYKTPDQGQRKVYYAGRQKLEDAIIARSWIIQRKAVPSMGDGLCRGTAGTVGRTIRQISRW